MNQCVDGIASLNTALSSAFFVKMSTETDATERRIVTKTHQFVINFVEYLTQLTVLKATYVTSSDTVVDLEMTCP